jgi:DNA-directed RNA polymerase specialized sigma24 family protein
VDLTDINPALDEPDPELLALDESLRELEQQHPRKAEVIKLRFFAGLTTAQAAVALGVSISTAENDWAYARSWLRIRMGESDGEQP